MFSINSKSETETSIADKISQRNQKVNDDEDDEEYSLSNDSSQSSTLQQNKTSSAVPLKVYW